MSRVIINHKNGEKEILTTVDDIDMYRDHVEIYFYYPETEPIPTRTIYKKDVKSVYEEYDFFGTKKIERIL